MCSRTTRCSASATSAWCPRSGRRRSPPLNYASDADWFKKAENWLTVGQQLAVKVWETQDQTNKVPLYELPGAETLQFKRSVVDGYAEDQGNLATRSNQLIPALPVALRIFDGFDYAYGTNRTDNVPGNETLPALQEPLAGQININTAPYEVLRMLPFVEDQDMQAGHDLAATIINYRDVRDVVSPVTGSPGPNFGIGVLRDATHGIEDARDEPAFTSIAELLMLFDENQEAMPGAIDYMLSGNNEDYPFYDITEDDAVNDAEEERLIFSSLSNMVTVRSDMFCVYLKVRGYRDDDQIDRPSVEERWLAIIDRSNVAVPGDKARIVFMQRIE